MQRTTSPCCTEQFMNLATPYVREQFTPWLTRAAHSWQQAQLAFLEMTDHYVEMELAKDPRANIDAHDAGGQWRIGFPHYHIRGDNRLPLRFETVMTERRNWVNHTMPHGFAGCGDNHHEIESFIFFQLPLFYAKLPGWRIALSSIEDFAHHVGNWVKDVPEWYDWERHEFKSNWLGTEKLRAEEPYHYVQDANHFRFIAALLAAYLGTVKNEYLSLAKGYANRWCDHIENEVSRGGPVRCVIRTSDVSVEAITPLGNSSGLPDAEVLDSTAYDIACALLDLYRITGVSRYLEASQVLFDQFAENLIDGRPAELFADGQWCLHSSMKHEPYMWYGWHTSCTYLAKYALKHELMTGMKRYNEVIVEWADRIDETTEKRDQMMANVLIAAHFYTGNTEYLRRAYAMAIRFAAVMELNDLFEQCNYGNRRQACRFLMESLYQPLLGTCEWGTRGSIASRLFAHTNPKGAGLPRDVALRIWQQDAITYQIEAHNLTKDVVNWQTWAVNSPRNPEHQTDLPVSLKAGEHVQATLSAELTDVAYKM